MRRADRGPEWKPRKCPTCKLTFVPQDKNPANAKRKRFCTRKCKDGFHRNGGMNLDRLMEVVARKTKADLLKDDAFLETLRDKLRVTPDRTSAPSIVGVPPGPETDRILEQYAPWKAKKPN
jgi:hypothetical protein